MSKVKDMNCGCLACRAPGLFTRHNVHWVVCPPCYDHLAEHFQNESDPPPPPWNEGVGVTDKKEECLLEETGCVACGKSHRAVLEESTTPPEDPCDEEFMEDISS